MQMQNNYNIAHAGFFEGIGGFAYAAKCVGWKTGMWCEINPFGQRVLRYHYPEAVGYSDITKQNFSEYAGRVKILTGGFPCQPYSTAGLRKGTEDERHLWPYMLTGIEAIKPSWVVGENVRGIANWNAGVVFEQVQTDLENIGYTVQPFLLPAVAVNAPHRRDRIWFIGCRKDIAAHANSRGLEGAEKERRNSQYAMREGGTGSASNTNSFGWLQSQQEHNTEQHHKGGDEYGIAANTSGQGLERGEFNEAFTAGMQRQQPPGPAAQLYKIEDWAEFPTESPICGGNDGLPGKLSNITLPRWRREAIKALGNAILPQVAIQIFKAIQEYEKIYYND